MTGLKETLKSIGETYKSEDGTTSYLKSRAETLAYLTYLKAAVDETYKGTEDYEYMKDFMNVINRTFMELEEEKGKTGNDRKTEKTCRLDSK